mgnify:CR=1 FL=1
MEDIKQALQELEPEEATQIALSTLRNSGYVVRAWCRDDVLSIAEQDPEFEGYSEDEKTKIINRGDNLPDDAESRERVSAAMTWMRRGTRVKVRGGSADSSESMLSRW